MQFETRSKRLAEQQKTIGKVLDKAEQIAKLNGMVLNKKGENTNDATHSSKSP